MENFKYLTEVIILFEKYLKEFGGQVVPCTHEEVNILESMLPQPYRLPAAYKEFLLYGGKEMADLFNLADISYQIAKFWLEHREEIFDIIYGEDSDAQLPPDMFVIEEHLGGSVGYFRLTEGEDPPVYYWYEGDQGGLEVAQKDHDSFSDYLINLIRIKGTYNMGRKINKSLKAKTPPRGQQFWLPTCNEFREGVPPETLSKYLGIVPQEVQEITALVGLDLDSYLEELSGWKCRKVAEDDNEVRFFPPET